jgi:hypothetical protein
VLELCSISVPKNADGRSISLSDAKESGGVSIVQNGRIDEGSTLAHESAEVSRDRPEVFLPLHAAKSVYLDFALLELELTASPMQSQTIKPPVLAVADHVWDVTGQRICE